jgi:uncharacterized protein YndB with AHSA1/START domain
MKNLEISTGIQVLKPVATVYAAIAEWEQMKNYFISESSGNMEEGKTVTWKFPEMDLSFPVVVGKLEKNRFISYTWEDYADQSVTTVEMHFSEITPECTFLKIFEKSKENNEAGIHWLKRNTEGWANFLACLKAWLEYGVHLRKGAFNPAQIPS